MTWGHDRDPRPVVGKLHKVTPRTGVRISRPAAELWAMRQPWWSRHLELDPNHRTHWIWRKRREYR